MGTPKGVATFSDGSFALSEYSVQEIKKFGPDGTFLETISRKGRGPGEFLNVESIFVDDQDQLLAVDHNQLKLVRFDNYGNNEEYYIFGNRPSIRSFHQTSSGSYIVGMKAFLGMGEAKNNYIFQEINEDFEFSGKAYVTLNDIHEAIKEDIGKRITKGMRSNTDSSVLTEEDDLVLAPKLYSGTMIVFKDKSENGFRDKQYLHTGDYSSAVEEYSSSRKIDYDTIRKEGVTILGSAGSSIRYFRYNESFGLFRLSSGQIIHFIQVQKKGEPKLIAELLDSKAENVIAVQELDKLGDLLIKDSILEFERYGRINLGFLNLDHQNRLFVVSHDEWAIPELHVIQLSVN